MNGKQRRRHNSFILNTFELCPTNTNIPLPKGCFVLSSCRSKIHKNAYPRGLHEQDDSSLDDFCGGTRCRIHRSDVCHVGWQNSRERTRRRRHPTHRPSGERGLHAEQARSFDRAARQRQRRRQDGRGPAG